MLHLCGVDRAHLVHTVWAVMSSRVQCCIGLTFLVQVLRTYTRKFPKKISPATLIAHSDNMSDSFMGRPVHAKRWTKNLAPLPHKLKNKGMRLGKVLDAAQSSQEMDFSGIGILLPPVQRHHVLRARAHNGDHPKG